MRTLRHTARQVACASVRLATSQRASVSPCHVAVSVMSRRWCSAGPPSSTPPEESQTASRFSRSRPSQPSVDGESTSIPTHSGDCDAPVLNMFASARTLTRCLQDILRACAQGICDGQRESFLAQLARGTLRQVASLDGKTVVLCVEAICALQVQLSAVEPIPFAPEAAFCRHSCAHLVEEAVQWMQAQGARLDREVALRLVCAVSDAKYPSRAALLARSCQQLALTTTGAPLSDRLRLAVAVRVSHALYDDLHHTDLQTALVTLCGEETLSRGQYGSELMSLGDLVAFLSAVAPLAVSVTDTAQHPDASQRWQRMASELWTAVHQRHSEDSALEALSLENATLLLTTMRHPTDTRMRADHASLAGAVIHRILRELPTRAEAGLCSPTLVARLIQLTGPQAATPSSATDSAGDGSVVVGLARLQLLSAHVYQDMLMNGVATACSAAPLFHSLREQKKTAGAARRMSFWDRTVLPRALQNMHVPNQEAKVQTDALTHAMSKEIVEWAERCVADGEGTPDRMQPVDLDTLLAVVGALPHVTDESASSEAKRASSLRCHLLRRHAEHLKSIVKTVEATEASATPHTKPLINPALILPLVLASQADLSEAQRGLLEHTVQICMHRWTVLQVVGFLQFASDVDTGLVRSILRGAAEALVTHVQHASVAQVGALLLCYGQAGVRQDDFCQAATKRLHVLLKPSALANSEDGKTAVVAHTQSSPAVPQPVHVRVGDLAAALAGLAAVEYNNTAAFVDASGRILESASTITDPFVLAQLMAAYARMLIWDFPLFWALADSLVAATSSASSSSASRREQVSFSVLVTAVLSLTRMDVPHKGLIEVFVNRVADLQGRVSTALTTEESVLLLAVLSRLNWKDMKRDGASTDVTEACRRVQVELKTVLVEKMPTFSDEAFAEIAVCLSRLDLLHGDARAEPSAPAAQETQLTSFELRAITIAPTASPTVIAHLSAAFATAPKPNAELFAVLAERTVSTKNDISAASLGSILAAFADARVENDRLFIEALPRVRHVGDYGTPADLTNIVSAYARVHIWHYKLFSRLAERAIHVRHEFNGATLSRFLEAYARVGMRHDKLTTEMTSRVELLAELMTPRELASIATSYAALDAQAEVVFQSCAQQVCLRAKAFTQGDATAMLTAFSRAGFTSADSVEALVTQYPELASLAQQSDTTETDGD